MRFFLLLLVCFCAACTPKSKVKFALSERTLLPEPDSLVTSLFAFTIDEATRITGNTPEAVTIAEELATLISNGTGISLQTDTHKIARFNRIHFQIDTTLAGNSEFYKLKSQHANVTVKAPKPAGLYRGYQTLVQLLPDVIFENNFELSELIIPGVTITDQPAYTYRGAMLDVARHFFTVDQVKRYIDQLVQYKINTLHLHLTDDQGWRIEIKSWPKLTEIGGKTAVGGGSGGFYTQEQYAEIVNYAASKYITVIPEIDMPGHTNAALVSYPELNCDGKPKEMYTGMRVGFSTFCVDSNITYQFVDDVIREIAALTPGDYIHLGGDESLATSDTDYVTFLNKAMPIVKKHGKKVMGWEDIGMADIDDTTIIQHWTSEAKAQVAIDKGARVVLSPAKKTYLDMKYTKADKIGLLWSGPTTIDSAYVWKPSLVFSDINPDQVIGIESPLWGETIVTSDDLEYLAFPRIIGHAVHSWKGDKAPAWEVYIEQLKKHTPRLEAQGINYYKSPLLETKLKQ